MAHFPHSRLEDLPQKFRIRHMFVIFHEMPQTAIGLWEHCMRRRMEACPVRVVRPDVDHAERAGSVVPAEGHHLLTVAPIPPQLTLSVRVGHGIVALTCLLVATQLMIIEQ
jgi:hypothetical protein